MSDSRSNSSHSSRRRATSAADLGFFTPSATSFQPRPYNPNASAPLPIPKPPPPRNHMLSHQVPPMDPSPADPSAVFLHPPFTAFPDAHLHPQGLNYTLMAANPEWFLDPEDFISSISTNPNAIPYPSQLEPPRGWCPSKKRDLKDRGSDGWPEGEEPRLRCTFCRRTYAGVNAKSMWRRHVYEKHKIAMANRRDTSDRARKGVNKDGKHTQEKENMTAPRAKSGAKPPSSTGSKSKLRSIRPSTSSGGPALYERANGSESLDDEEEDNDDTPTPSAPRIPQEEFFAPSTRVRPPASQTSSRATPTPPPDSPQSDAPELGTVSDDDPPTPRRPLIPSSPYDPSTTPSFRHSPPRLPSDQPWRYASPSHPLHSIARDLSLSAVALSSSSPVVTGTAPTGIDVSPVVIAPRTSKGSVFSTPSLAVYDSHKESGATLKGLGLSSVKPTPRRLFSTSSIPASANERLKKGFRPVEESPLRYGISFTPRASKSSHTSMDSSSPTRMHFDGGSLLSPSLAIEDPFVHMYGSLAEFHRGQLAPRSSSPSATPESESPVIHRTLDSDISSSGSRSGSVKGIGLSLMEPFSLKRGLELDDDEDDEDSSENEDLQPRRLMLASPVSRCRLTATKSFSELKANRTGDDSPTARSPLRKRRRTIAGDE